MIWKYSEGALFASASADARIQECRFLVAMEIGPRGYREAFEGGAPEYPGLEAYAIEDALHHTWAVSGWANRLVDATSPWKVAKDPVQQSFLTSILYHLAESLRIIAILISPVLPKAAHGIFDQLNWKMEATLAGREARFSLADAEWGRLPDGHVVGKPVPLFPRIET